MRRFVVATLFGALVAGGLFGGPRDASAQAWTRDQGEGYLNLNLTSLSGNRAFAQDGSTREIVPYTQTIVGLYSELGLIDRWLTLTINAELLRRNALEDLAATQGFGDLRVGLWSGVIDAPFRLTLGVVVGLPTGDDDVTVDPGTDVEIEQAAASLPTGDGEFDITPVILVGHSFGGQSWPLQHFATARVGYWLRTRGFSDAIRYQAELGTRIPGPFIDRFWLILRFRGVESFSGPSNQGFSGLGDGITFTSAGGELYGRIWSGLGASIEADTAFRGKGIIAAVPLRFKVSYEF